MTIYDTAKRVEQFFDRPDILVEPAYLGLSMATDQSVILDCMEFIASKGITHGVYIGSEEDNDSYPGWLEFEEGLFDIETKRFLKESIDDYMVVTISMSDDSIPVFSLGVCVDGELKISYFTDSKEHLETLQGLYDITRLEH